MAISRSVASTDIRCPRCGGVRVVDVHTARSKRTSRLCAACRGQSPTRVARDRDLAFWLRMYGVSVPRGVKARDVLAASGVPPDLADFAKSVFPP